VAALNPLTLPVTLAAPVVVDTEAVGLLVQLVRAPDPFTALLEAKQNEIAVDAPLAFMDPFKVAEVLVTADAAFVVAVGTAGGR
jgi:hypothetical protein